MKRRRSASTGAAAADDQERIGCARVDDLTVADGFGERGVVGDENARFDELERTGSFGQLLVEVVGESGSFQLVAFELE